VTNAIGVGAEMDRHHPTKCPRRLGASIWRARSITSCLTVCSLRRTSTLASARGCAITLPTYGTARPSLIDPNLLARSKD